MDESGRNYLSFFKEHALPIVIGVAGLIFFGYGLMSLSGNSLGSAGQSSQDRPDILFEAASTSEVPSREISIDVQGAVMKAGVYKLKSDSRMQDALVAAGGLSEDADREKVAKTLNLASKLTDGAKIYIPAVGEVGSVVAGASTVSDGNSGTININSASEEELDSLSGVGKVTAAKIIDNRPYAKIEDLLEKKIVGKSVFDKIKDKIGV